MRGLWERFYRERCIAHRPSRWNRSHKNGGHRQLILIYGITGVSASKFASTIAAVTPDGSVTPATSAAPLKPNR